MLELKRGLDKDSDIEKPFFLLDFSNQLSNIRLGVKVGI